MCAMHSSLPILFLKVLYRRICLLLFFYHNDSNLRETENNAGMCSTKRKKRGGRKETNTDRPFLMHNTKTLDSQRVLAALSKPVSLNPHSQKYFFYNLIISFYSPFNIVLACARCTLPSHIVFESTVPTHLFVAVLLPGTGTRFLISKFLITKFLITLFLIRVFLSNKVPKLQNS